MKFRKLIIAAVAAQLSTAVFAQSMPKWTDPIGTLQSWLRDSSLGTKKEDVEWKKAAPAVDENQGIGWQRGRIFGVDRSTDFTARGDFAALESKPSGRELSLDLGRLMKLDGDSDKYAYWLATSFSFDELVDAYKRSAENKGSDVTNGDVDQGALNNLEAIRRTAMAPWVSCANELSNRENMNPGFVSQTFACERHELRVRQQLKRDAANGPKVMATMSYMLITAPVGTGNRSPSIPTAYKFTNGKKRIGLAWGTLAQANYVAINGQQSDNIGHILRMPQRPDLATYLAVKALDESGRPTLYRWPYSDPLPTTAAEDVAIATVAIKDGKQQIAQGMQKFFQEQRISE